MIYLILAIGVFSTVFGAISYSLLRKREGVMYKIFGHDVPREWTSFGLFIFGCFLIIMFLVVEVEPQFYKTRSLQYPSNQIFHLIDELHLDT
ncbi:hypothetical protein LBMAG27_14390 [Bacteroidota bacterium]|nr:hypothetical protein LBMAG27_14390 [Bacteroidota bacterium]